MDATFSSCKGCLYVLLHLPLFLRASPSCRRRIGLKPVHPTAPDCYDMCCSFFLIHCLYPVRKYSFPDILQQSFHLGWTIFRYHTFWPPTPLLMLTLDTLRILVILRLDNSMLHIARISPRADHGAHPSTSEVAGVHTVRNVLEHAQGDITFPSK